MNIFFDFDGTLASPVNRHYSVYKAVIEKMGGLPLEINEYWAKKRSKTNWDQLLEQSGVAAERKEEFIAMFIPLIEDEDYLLIDELLPGALTALEQLSKDNQCYLVSLRRNNDNLLYQLEHLGISGYFKEILSGHSETDGADVKSEIIRNRLSGRDLVVGDAEADVRAAQLLEIPVVAMTTGIRDYQFLSALKPDYILASIAELPTIVAELNSRY